MGADAANQLAKTGRKLAVLIGIDAYQHDIPALRNAVRDIETVGAVLRDLYGYELRFIRDAQATLAALRELLRALPAELNAGDSLVLYFAGHGVAEELLDAADGPQGFLIPQDAKADEPQSFLAMTYVQQALEGLSCRHMLLLLDCCFAGAFRWSRTREVYVRRAPLYRERFERYKRDSAWQVITSSAHDERAADWVAGKVLGSRGDGQDNSPFAAALCAGLRGDADLRIGGQPGDGVILASELHLYLETAFDRLEKQYGRALQKPMMWALSGHDKGQFFFVLPDRSIELPAAAEMSEKNNPYLGLQGYKEEHRALFFGRTAVAESLCALVQTAELVVVVGASGTGKSSLICAGLLPRLRGLRAPQWRLMPPQRPGSSPLLVLQTAAAELTPGAASLPAAVATFVSAHPDEKLLLFIDQTEEIISHAPAELPAFLAQLDEARQAGAGQLHIVLALRADFEPYFEALRREGTARRFLIPPMSRAELREAIEGPAAERVLFFDPPTLCERLLDEVADTPGPLPLLSFVLSEMYRASLRRRRDRTLADADYQALGGVSGALSQRADAVYAEYADAAEQRAFRYLLLRMVVPGELARKRVFDSELVFTAPAEQQRVRHIVKRLLEERLLVSDLDSHGQKFIEPAHDKLVMGWPQLGRFLAHDKGYLLHHSLSEAARVWERNQRDSAYLWDRDPLLPQAVTTQKLEPGRYNQLEEEFVKRSQRRRRRGRGLIALIVLLIVGSLGTWLQQERRAARRAQQQLLAAYQEQGRQFLLQKNAATALLWLNRAYQQGGDDPSLRFLLAQATRSQELALPPLGDIKGPVEKMLFSPDGTRILTLSRQDPSPKIWDTRSGELLDSLEGHTAAAVDAVYSPDGSQILTASMDRTAKLWDAATGILLDSLQHEHQVTHVAFNADGSRALTAADDDGVRLWETKNGGLLTTQAGTKKIQGIRFNRKGRAVIAEHSDHSIAVWDAAKDSLWEWGIGAIDSLSEVGFSADGEHIITIGADKAMWQWDLLEKKPREPLLLDHDPQPFIATAISPAGHRLIAAYPDRLKLWALPQGRLLAELPDKLELGAARPKLIFSPDGTRFLAYSASGAVRIFTEDGKLLHTLLVPELRHASFSADGALIATVAEGKPVQIWDVQSGLPHALLHGSISPKNGNQPQDGPGPSPRDKEDGLWTTYSNLPIRSLNHRGRAISAELSPDGQHCLIVSMQPGFGPFRDGEVHTFLEDGTDSSRGLSRSSVASLSALSPDGKFFAAAGVDINPRLFDAVGGAQREPLRGHTGRITAVAFSADGRRIVTGSRDKTARIWDVASGRTLATLVGHGDVVHTVLFTADGRHVVTIDESGRARYWDARTGSLLATFGDTGSVRAVHISGDGSRLVIGNNTETLVWDTGSEKPLARHSVSSVGYLMAVSPDGRRLVLNIDSAVVIGDAVSGAAIGKLLGHAGSIAAVTYSADGERLITAGQDKTARVFAAADGHALLTLAGHTGGVVSAQFSRDGLRIVTASQDKTARLWDARSGMPLVTFIGHETSLLNASISDDGQRILTIGESDGTIRLWDAQGKQLFQQAGGSFWVFGASYSPDGRAILTNNSDGIFRIWDASGSFLLGSLSVPKQGRDSAAWTPDSTRVLTVGREQVIRIWDAKTSQLLQTIPGPRAERSLILPHVSMSRDLSHLLLLGPDRTLRLWDAHSGALQATLDARQYEFASAEFSPDSRRIVTTSDVYGVSLWSVPSGRLEGELTGHTDRVNSIAWSPDGQKLVTASADKTARIFAVPSRQSLLTLGGHQAAIETVQFSPDGMYVLTASTDRTAKIWDARNGALLASMDGIDENRPLAAYSADGRFVVTGNQDGAIKLWHLFSEQRSPKEIDDLCRCRVPLQFQGESVVRTRRDPSACQRLRKRR